MIEHNAPPVRAAKPRGLTFVVVLMYLQALFNFVGGLLMQSELDNALRHNFTVLNEGFVKTTIVLAFVICLPQLICGLLIPRRIPWTRELAITVELITIAFALFATFETGTYTQALAVLLPSLALRRLLTPEFAGWFRPQGRA